MKLMIHNLKSRMFKAIGRNIEECRDALEEGFEQGRILRRKYKEAQEEMKAKQEEPQPEEFVDIERDEPTTNNTHQQYHTI